MNVNDGEGLVQPNSSKISAIQQIKIRSLLGGLLTFLPFGTDLLKLLRNILRRQRKDRPLEYGLNVLLHRLDDAELNVDFLKNKVFLEIAPGDNFSGPIAAVVLGAKKAIGIDAYDYTEFGPNSDIAKDFCTKLTISENQTLSIIRDLDLFDKNSPSKHFSYFAPYKSTDIPNGSLDIITSLSTMEHVQQPDQLYDYCYDWLKPGGVMIHKIDFSAHGICRDWFGHLLLPNMIFTMAVGRRSHMNRWTERQHVDACSKLGFFLQKRLAFNGSNPPPKPYEDLPLAATHIWIKKQPDDSTFNL